jgi:hypothetical protein
MMIALFLVFAAVVALVVILRLAVSRKLEVANPAVLAGRIQPMDVEAFRNLVDAVEDEYLRDRLPPADFRAVRRARLQAAAAYVQAASRNAAVLIRIGQATMLSADPQVADAAQQLVNCALLLRRNATVAMARIYIAWAFPASGVRGARLADRYERMNGSALLLGRLQNPVAGARFSVAAR